MSIELLEEAHRLLQANRKLREMISRLLGYDMEHQWDMTHHCDAKYDRGPCDCSLEETLREAGELLREQEERDPTPRRPSG